MSTFPPILNSLDDAILRNVKPELLWAQLLEAESDPQDGIAWRIRFALITSDLSHLDDYGERLRWLLSMEHTRRTVLRLTTVVRVEVS